MFFKKLLLVIQGRLKGCKNFPVGFRPLSRKIEKCCTKEVPKLFQGRLSVKSVSKKIRGCSWKIER